MTSPRRQRADAARNVERIIRAAREVYAEQGASAPIDEVARRAGVGISTLFRHFADKKELVRAALHQGFTEQLGPVLERSLHDDDPYRGLISALEACLALADGERRLLAAAGDLGVRTMTSTDEALAAFTLLVRRAQEAGVVRADLVADDVPRILVMLLGVTTTTEPGSDGWRRYVALIGDALAPAAAHPLPDSVPLAGRARMS